jgi:predicted nucleic acid-binding protein
MAEKDEFVVDSSVVTRWFLVESDSDLAPSLRDDFATGRVSLAVPTLLFYELLNALRFSGAFDEKGLALAGRALSKYQSGIWRPRRKLLELSAMQSQRRT